jgi:hypothetical protein
MTILSPDEIRSLRSVTATSISTWSKPGLHKVGKDIYELLTNTGSRGYKQQQRKRRVPICSLMMSA